MMHENIRMFHCCHLPFAIFFKIKINYFLWNGEGDTCHIAIDQTIREIDQSNIEKSNIPTKLNNKKIYFPL